jgi:hypothetical protein
MDFILLDVSGTLTHSWRIFFFLNFSAKFCVCLVKYIRRPGFEGYLNILIFSTLKPPKSGRTFMDAPPVLLEKTDIFHEHN